ncbi:MULTISPECIES: hypothetical protein [unclassified Microcoleus]|uniref:hypothetical protein n=2 Tax=unclassified Microcoleus TaxID=2642155 RepID=UPI002FD5AB44
MPRAIAEFRRNNRFIILGVGGGKEVTKLMGDRHFSQSRTKERSHFFQHLDESAIALFYIICTYSVLISVKLVSLISFARSIAPPTLSLTSRWSKISSVAKKAICAIDHL